MADIYTQPGDFGLSVVREYDSGKRGSYGFDLLVVWKKDESYFFCTDTGCSCPTPFDSFSMDDLIPITPRTFGIFLNELDHHLKDADPGLRESAKSFARELQDILSPPRPFIMTSVASRCYLGE